MLLDHGAGRLVELVDRGRRAFCLTRFVGVANEEHAQPVLAGLHATPQELQRREQFVERIGDLYQYRRRADQRDACSRCR